MSYPKLSYPKLPKLNSHEWESDGACPSPTHISGQIPDHLVTSKKTADTGRNLSEVDRKNRPAQQKGHANVMGRNTQTNTRLNPKVMAYTLGIGLHMLHLCLRMHRMQYNAECNCSWEDFPSVDAEGAWIDWADLGCVILMAGTALHGLFILTRFAICRPVSRNVTMAVWFPTEFELMLFCVYSPAHAFIWMATTSANWILMVVIMVTLSKQMHTLSQAYYMVISNREIMVTVPVE